jgi:predicted nuclease of predicted toxin-antitoxin system
VRFLFDHDVPDDLSYLFPQLGHEVLLLRHVLTQDASDFAVLKFARENQLLLVTCNRDDFLKLAREQSHHGISLSYAAKHVPPSGPPCFVYWMARERAV